MKTYKVKATNSAGRQVSRKIKARNQNEAAAKMRQSVAQCYGVVVMYEIVATRKGYELRDNGQLWTTGKHSYRAGYVSDPEMIEEAIENHEEELATMLAQF